MNKLYALVVIVIIILILIHKLYKLYGDAKNKNKIKIITSITSTPAIHKTTSKIQDNNPLILSTGLTNGSDKLPDEIGDTEVLINPYAGQVEQIPRNTGCTDEFSRCSEWAANNECEANPNFMLHNCPNSCKTCGLSVEEKSNLMKYYNHEPIKKCIYRGESYPSAVVFSV